MRELINKLEEMLVDDGYRPDSAVMQQMVKLRGANEVVERLVAGRFFHGERRHEHQRRAAHDAIRVNH